MKIKVPTSSLKRIVIIGGGFGGLKLAQSLAKSNFQIVLVDRNNFHQFQPLFYQVATSGLEPSSIIFPFRKIFQRFKNVHFRFTEVIEINSEKNLVLTKIGSLRYDYLVISTGVGNNFFGNQKIEKYALPMKSITESLRLRNVILERFEDSVSVSSEEQFSFLHFVIVGAGPTGVELAGTLAEMKRFVLPKDYPELDFGEMKITLIEGSDRVLSAMNSHSSKKARMYLEKMGVELRLSTLVQDYDGDLIKLSDETTIESKTLIWAAGIKGNFLSGLSEQLKGTGNRILVDEFNRVQQTSNIFAVGDIALMSADANYSNGHPQLAQVAIQQAKQLAENFKRLAKHQEMVSFKYKNLGTMATVGRNKAVVELPKRNFSGFFAWIVWMVVHLRSILGVKNRWIIFTNWVWNYFTYNLSLRLIIKRKDN